MTRPIFILSLPRSGSTLLQRLLLSSGHCATLGEPSLLLRFLGNDEVMTRKAMYWEFLVSISMQDMREAWSGFDNEYRAGVRDLMMRIYKGLSGDKEWFIDKTPRYALIAEEILKTFPDSKIIVLWRHPLAVAASMFCLGRKSWGRYWFPQEYAIDLYEGLHRLQTFARNHADQICEVRYEDLVVNPESELRRIGAYLGWKGLELVLEQPLLISAGGSLGDPTGGKKFCRVSTDSLEAWKKVYSNWYRRRWARSYFSGMRAEALAHYSYALPENFITPHYFNFFAGIKDWALAANREERRFRHPVWLRRFLRKYRKAQGYDVAFR